VALGYDETEDPSIYIKFKVDRLSIVGTPLEQIFKDIDLVSKHAYFLAWTTTPWTLPGNTALAVAPDAEYSILEGPEDHLIMASALVNLIVLEGYSERARINGSDIAGKRTSEGGEVTGVEGIRYQPLFNPHDYGVKRRRFKSYIMDGGEIWHVGLEDQPEDNNLTYPVIAADFVSLEDGTGIVHIAPSFGEDDFAVGGDNVLNFVRDYVDLQGVIQGTYPFAGKFVKDADPLILENLKSRGLLYRSDRISHTYPFCWRCNTPLLYYAKESWYVRTTACKAELVSGNEQINWYPEYIKYGRFGDWLQNNVDWAFSRERFWGTPLPIWHCDECRERPFKDRFQVVGSVADLRSKPGLQGLVEPIDLHRPFVDRITFSCAACGGMMKRVPEVLDAWFDSGAMPLAQFHYPFENQAQFEASFPADYICEAVDQTRGWFYTLHALSTLLFQRPCFENVICLGHILDVKGEKMSKAKGNVVDPWEIISAYGADALRWYMFTSTPAGNVKRFDARQVKELTRKFLSTLWNTYSFFVLYANIDNFVPTNFQPPVSPAELDRWIASELNQLILQVTEDMENYNPTDAGRRIEEFVERLSNWYVRRSRRRFWKSENDSDKLSAYFTLYECLVTLSKLMAPLAPFVAEEMYQNLVRSVDPESEESVHLCSFPSPDLTKIDDRLAAEMRLAMKVSSMGRAARSKAGIKVRQPLAKVVIKTRSRSERAGLERLAPQVLEELNAKDMEFVEAASELVDKPGYAMATEGDYIVALSTDIPEELIKEGLAREVVHRLQTMRRNAGFDIADHINTCYQADPPLQQAIEHLSTYIKQETLSRELICQTPHEGTHSEQFRIHGHNITLGVARIDAS